MRLRIYRMLDGVTKLGPGCRFCLWTQGCLRNCAGCMTRESRALDGGVSVDVDDAADRIIRSGRTGLTISGGEPFLQAEALAELITKVRQEIDLGVIVYTGYTYEELLSDKDESFRRLLDVCDLIIDGSYEEALNDGKNLRGSSNQRAIPLTDRYIDFTKEIGTKPAEIEFFVQEDKICMVGIPTRRILERFCEE